MTRGGATLVVGCALLASCALISGADDLVVEALDGGDRTDARPAEASVIDAGADEDAPFDGGADTGGGPCYLDGLIARWKLDENGGTTIHDCSPNGLDGQLDGGLWVPGRDGGAALELDGGWVGLGDPPALRLAGPFTITAWISDDVTTTSTQYVFGRRAETNTPGWRLATDPPRLSFSIAPDVGPAGTLTAGTVPARTWMHVAAVYVPGQTMLLYRDGTRIAALDAGVPSAIANPNVEARIGARSDGLFPFIGTLDDVRVYGRALSPAEIAAVAAE